MIICLLTTTTIVHWRSSAVFHWSWCVQIGTQRCVNAETDTLTLSQWQTTVCVCRLCLLITMDLCLFAHFFFVLSRICRLDDWSSGRLVCLWIRLISLISCGNAYGRKTQYFITYSAILQLPQHCVGDGTFVRPHRFGWNNNNHIPTEAYSVHVYPVFTYLTIYLRMDPCWRWQWCDDALPLRRRDTCRAKCYKRKKCLSEVLISTKGAPSTRSDRTTEMFIIICANLEIPVHSKCVVSSVYAYNTAHQMRRLCWRIQFHWS